MRCVGVHGGQFGESGCVEKRHYHLFVPLDDVTPLDDHEEVAIIRTDGAPKNDKRLVCSGWNGGTKLDSLNM